jgi:hypothetical protein
MLSWLFGSARGNMTVIAGKETLFSKLPNGQEFQKVDGLDSTLYMKTDEAEYETVADGWHCTKWYRVHEDFMVKV